MNWKRVLSAAGAAGILFAAAPQAGALAGVSGWAQGEIDRAKSAGLLPEVFHALPARDAITRAEFCAVALRLFETGTGRVVEQSSEQPFSDTKNTAVVAASSLGLVSGRGDGTFDPEATITRQELCVMLGNVLRAAASAQDGADSILPDAFPDKQQVAAWAVGDMAEMVAGGVMSGVIQDDGSVTLSPRATATREQSLMMAVRFLETYDFDDVHDDTDTDTKPPNPDQDTHVPPVPSADLTEAQKELLVFGNGGRGFETQAEAEAAMAEITVPIWRLQADGGKTASKMTLTVHEKLAPIYVVVFEEIFAGSEQFPVKNGGGYAWRANTKSEHRWGTAIDLNWEENMECSIDEDGNVLRITSGKLWQPGENPYSIPEDGDVVRAFKNHGFAWGGDAWKGKRDYMHFSYFGR